LFNRLTVQTTTFLSNKVITYPVIGKVFLFEMPDGDWITKFYKIGEIQKKPLQ